MLFLAGMFLGLVLGIVISNLWPKQTVVADTVMVRAEFARMEKGLISSVGVLHEKLDAAIAEIKKKV